MIHDLNRRDESLTIGDKWRISVCQFSETGFKTSCLLKDTSFFLMEEEYVALGCFFDHVPDELEEPKSSFYNEASLASALPS